MTIGSDARQAAANAATDANSGFVSQSAVNLGLQATERQALADYLESIKPAIRDAVVGKGYFHGGFKLQHALKNTEGVPPKHARYLIDEPGHPYNQVWADFVAWSVAEELVGPVLFKETLYLLPPPNENYDFSLRFKLWETVAVVTPS